jgi:hypothetical protein
MIAAGLAHRRLILSRGFEIRSRAKPSVQFLGTSSGENTGVVFASVDIDWLYHLAEDEARGKGLAVVPAILIL